jgi:trans-2,3-dihydro-3-hydroxyanthranilate isomerase
MHGNPLAVFVDAEGLSDDEMQALAREMNLSETAFVLPPTEHGRAAGADYRLCIFTPGMELPFAGHPSIGTAWVLADEGRFELHRPRTRIRAELAIGVLPLSLEVLARPAAATVGAGGTADAGGPAGAERPSLGAVTMTQGGVEELHELDSDEVFELCEALEVPPSELGWRNGGSGRKKRARPAVISTGLPHLIVPFADRAVMADVDHQRRSYVAEICGSLGCDSAALVAPGSSGAITDADVCVRLFDAGSLGIDVDPATGAAAGPIAVYLGRLAGARSTSHRVVIEQGAEVGRPSRLMAEVDFGPDGRPGEVRVSGSVVPLIEGWVTLP